MLLRLDQYFTHLVYALFAQRVFGFFITVLSKIKITIPKKISFYPPPLSFSILSLLFHLISLLSSFPFLSLLFPHFSLSPHGTFCTFFLLLPSNTCFLSSFPHLNLVIIFLSFALSLPRYSGIFTVIHLSYSLFYLDSLILPLLSCLFVSLSLSLSSAFIHLPLPLLHWHTRFSGSIPLCPSSPCFFFSLQHSVSVLHSSLPSILSSNFAALFPAFTLSLFLLHSSFTR
jgi:hypothetical protein